MRQKCVLVVLLAVFCLLLSSCSADTNNTGMSVSEPEPVSQPVATPELAPDLPLQEPIAGVSSAWNREESPAEVVETADGYKLVTDRSLFEYESDTEGVCITKYTGQESVVVFPDSINELPVTAIGDNCITDNADCVAIYIGQHVQALGHHAIMNCQNLETLQIAGYLTFVDEEAISDCPLLRYLVIKGQEGFHTNNPIVTSCEMLQELTVPATDIEDVYEYIDLATCPHTQVVQFDSPLYVRDENDME